MDALVAQLSAFNTFTVPPRERFKVLEVLRKAVFAVSGECQRRFDGKPLPLRQVTQRIGEAVANVDLKRLDKPLAERIASAPPFYSHRNFGSSTLE